MADAAPPELAPRKRFPRVALARRRDVGMGEDPLVGDRPAGANVARERNRGLDLTVRKRRRAALVAWIDDLDPDRGRVQIGFAFPRTPTCVPGAVPLRDQLVD